jgi:hypothetical protein
MASTTSSTRSPEAERIGTSSAVPCVRRSAVQISSARSPAMSSTKGRPTQSAAGSPVTTSKAGLSVVIRPSRLTVKMTSRARPTRER